MWCSPRTTTKRTAEIEVSSSGRQTGPLQTGDGKHQVTEMTGLGNTANGFPR